MDPKALSHLDPKQREAYDRVMGTAAEIHADATSDANISETPSSIDALTPPSAPEPFDTSIGGLTSSPIGDTPSPFGSSDSTSSSPSPSIFTNNAAEPDPTQTTIPQTDSSSPDSGSSTSSFFTNNPIPPAPAASPAPDVASPQGLPTASSEPSGQETTIPSDNLSNIEPVTPYSPDSSSNATMEQPFNTQPLPSPAEVNQSAHHESSALLRVLYIVGAVVFFAIYTIFWIKVFNLPFLF